MKIALQGLSWLVVCASALCGCTHTPSAHEQSLGQSVRQALAQQSLYPAGSPFARGPLSLDGVVAAHGVDRYEQSFARPQAPMNVLNILTGPTTGSTATTGVPR